MWEGYSAAARQEQLQTMAYQMIGRESHAPDPNFRWTPELAGEVTKDLDDDMAGYILDNAHSLEHAKALRARVDETLKDEQTLAQFGPWGNIGLRGAAILTDVPTWLIGAGAGKAAQGLKLAAKVGRLAAGGMIAVGENTVAEAFKYSQQPGYGLQDVLLNSTAAFALGAGFGKLFGVPGEDLDKALVGAAADTERELVEAAGHKLTPKGEDYYSRLGAKAPDQEARSLSAAGLPNLPEPSMREKVTTVADFSVGGRLAASKNSEVQELAELLDINAAGTGGRTPRAGESMFEEVRRRHTAAMAEVTPADREAFKAWADAQGMTMRQRIGEGYSRFQELVARKIFDPTMQVAKEIEDLADAYRGKFRQVLHDAQAAGAEWAQRVQDDDTYFPMIFNKQRIREKMERFGPDGPDAIQSVIRQAFQAANPNLTFDQARRAAKAYWTTIHEVSEGTYTTVRATIATDDAGILRKALMDQGVSRADADTILKVIGRADDEGPNRFKSRAALDDMRSFIPDGGTQADAFSVRDLTTLDAFDVFERYVREVSAHSAAAARGFTSRAALEAKAVDVTKGRVNQIPGFTDAHGERALDDLNYLIQRVFNDRPNDGAWLGGDGRAAAAILGNYNFMRVGGMFGLAQLGDMPKLLMRVGAAAAFRQFRLGDLAEVFSRGGKSANALTREAMVMTGAGTHMARKQLISRFQDLDYFYDDAASRTLLTRAAHVTRTGANFVSLASGMDPITDFLQRWATRGSLQLAFDVARGTKKLPQNQLNDLGLGQREIGILNSLAQNATFDGRGVLKAINMGAQNRDQLDWLAGWASRQARLAVLEPTPAMLPRIFGTVLGRLAMQFRTFTFAANAANTLRNINMGWGFAAKSLMVTGTWASMIYMLQTYYSSLSHPDSEKFLRERLSPERIVGAGFQRSADSGVLPMVMDTLIWAAGEEERSPFKDTRTSGLASNFVMGIPTVQLVNDLSSAIKEGINDPMRGGKVHTQEDAARLQRLLALGNYYGIADALRAYRQSLPKREPDDLAQQRRRF